MNIFKRAGLLALGVLFLACASGPTPAKSGSSDELDTAIRETSNYLNKQLPKGNKLVILNIQSEFPALSEYIIDELIANTVNDRIFSVADRQQLNTIRAELNFQMSGEVSDETAQSVGQMTGAQIIISGAVSKIGDLYRLRVRALNVKNAEIVGQFNKNIPDNSTVAALVRSQATGYGGEQTVTSRPAASQPASAPAAPVQTPAPPPAPVYKIGDKGPAGGLVFYDKGNNSGGWRYLEAASGDAGNVVWGVYTDLKGTKSDIGAGKQNTEILVNFMMETGQNMPAAMLCRQYSQGGYNDWFLPSSSELNLMYWNLKQKNLGSLRNGRYWSSLSNYPWGVHNQDFSDGQQGNDQGFYFTARLVRPIRAF